MAPYAGEMTPDEVVDLLAALVPTVHANGHDQHVEALTVAMDALTWFPLKSAPHDGRKVMLAVAPHPAFDAPGFVCIGRWVEPADNLLDQMGKMRRQRYAASGGWWSASKSGRPFGRGVLGWRPVPAFDFDAAGYGPNIIETAGGQA